MPENKTGVNVEGPGRTGSRLDRPVLIYATFPNLATAEQIGGQLVRARIAACVNLIPGMRSIYRWAGEIQCDAEVVGIVKTRDVLAERVIGWLRVAHPYALPAAVVLPVSGGSDAFLAWIVTETAGGIGGSD